MLESLLVLRSTTGITWLVPACFMVLLIVRSVIRAFFLSPRNVPGPFLARFSRLWYLKQVYEGGFEKTNIELHRRYGPVVRISPYEYTIDDPEAVRIVYGHGTHFTKGPWYFASGNPDGKSFDLFTDRSPTRHAANRRKVATLYSNTHLLKMESCVHECTQLLTNNFKRIAETGQIINLQFWMQCYAFDVIGLITVSRRFGLLDKGEDNSGMLNSLHQYLRYCASVGVYSELHSWIFKPVMMLGASGFAHMINFTAKQISEQKASPGKDDFLSRVLAMNKENPENFTDLDVFITCITNIGAGSDTTSISLTSIIYHLIKEPRCFEKLRAEIDENDSAGNLSSSVMFKEAQNLPYLQAVIKEALRLHPASGLPLGRVVPKGGAEIAGHYFPEQSIVGINTWVAHRNKDVFGEDAETFRPERWIENAERVRQMNDYYIPFGHGSRTCIGKNISMMEMSKLIPELIRRFDFTLAYPKRKVTTENVWFVKQMDIEVKVHLRASRATR